MKRSSLAMTLVMLVIFLVLVGIAWGYPANARFMPLVVGLPAIGLCLLQLAIEIRERRRVAVVDPRSPFEKAEEAVSRMAGRPVDFEIAHTPPAVVAAEAPAGGGDALWRRELLMWGYVLGFIASILVFGFWLAIPVFLVAFLRMEAQASWRSVLLLGLLATLAFYLVFEKGLRVSLHRGFATEFVTDRF